MLVLVSKRKIASILTWKYWYPSQTHIGIGITYTHIHNDTPVWLPAQSFIQIFIETCQGGWWFWQISEPIHFPIFPIFRFSTHEFGPRRMESNRLEQHAYCYANWKSFLFSSAAKWVPSGPEGVIWYCKYRVLCRKCDIFDCGGGWFRWRINLLDWGLGVFPVWIQGK